MQKVGTGRVEDVNEVILITEGVHESLRIHEAIL